MIRTAVASIAVALALGAASSDAADMKKTLHVAFGTAENGFDPQAVYDSYSFYVCHAIFDPLYSYDYFARPVRLVPNTAAALPEITNGGRTFTVKVPLVLPLRVKVKSRLVAPSSATESGETVTLTSVGNTVMTTSLLLLPPA